VISCCDEEKSTAVTVSGSSDPEFFLFLYMGVAKKVMIFLPSFSPESGALLWHNPHQRLRLFGSPGQILCAKSGCSISAMILSSVT
jgi:hypothetical protein